MHNGGETHHSYIRSPVLALESVTAFYRANTFIHSLFWFDINPSTPSTEKPIENRTGKGGVMLQQ